MKFFYMLILYLSLLYIAESCRDKIPTSQCQKYLHQICSSDQRSYCAKSCCLCTDWSHNCKYLISTFSCQHRSTSQLCPKSCCRYSEEWLDWSAWSECSKSCNSGATTRTRKCKTNSCAGNSLETRQCNTHRCPTWTKWTKWSSCSTTCSTGHVARSRDCVYRDERVKNESLCLGKTLQQKSCNRPPCQPTLPQLNDDDSGPSTRQAGPVLSAKGCEGEFCHQFNITSMLSCEIGYVWNNSTQLCEDVNECLKWNGGCPDRCVNTMGSYACADNPRDVTCSSGYRLRYGSTNMCCKKDVATSCGQNIEEDKDKIVGGEDAILGRWPWMARLLINGKSLCGGTMIHSKWVLTAAHCLRNKDVTRTGRVVVTVGILNQELMYERSRQYRMDKRTIIHPQFKFPQNDIALVEVDRPFDVSRIFARPVCLPNGEMPKTGQRCYATGFGTLEFRGQMAPVLQQVDLPIVDHPTCYNSYSRVGWKLKEYQFCAGYMKQGGRDSCQGDSGGPLVCQRCSSCSWYLAGVTSFGHGCAQPGFPGVYVGVRYFEDWISKHTGITTGNNATCKTVIEWQPWSSWIECSSSCGGGIQQRARICIRDGASVSDHVCTNQLGSYAIEQKTCNQNPCPIWTTWSHWGSCNATCGTALRLRKRACLHGSMNQCQGGKAMSFETQACNVTLCPYWSNWGQWGSCGATCGSDVLRSRLRICVNWTPGVLGCLGNQTSDFSNCGLKPCLSWSSWKQWSLCSTTCGRGSKIRKRQCQSGFNFTTFNDGVSVSPNKTGFNMSERTLNTECTGLDYETGSCRIRSCPRWKPWGQWLPCSVTCGGGTSQRTRVCSHSGECKGKSTSSKPCNDFITCPPTKCTKPLPNLSNGFYQCDDGNSIGSFCVFKCHLGYIIKGDVTATCFKNGNWSLNKTSRCESTIARKVYEIQGNWSKYNANIFSISTSFIGEWVIDTKGNIFYLNNSIKSPRYKENLRWMQVDVRGWNPSNNCSSSKINQVRPVEIRTEFRYLFMMDSCGNTFRRMGISLLNPTGYYWKLLKKTEQNKIIQSSLHKSGMTSLCNVTASTQLLNKSSGNDEGIISELCQVGNNQFMLTENGTLWQLTGKPGFNCIDMKWKKIASNIGGPGDFKLSCNSDFEKTYPIDVVVIDSNNKLTKYSIY